MNPFRNILRLSIGDFFAKTLGFLVFVYLARILGVSTYGVLELAIAILAYLLLLGDGGLELWATRAVARGGDVAELAGRVIPLRLILAGAGFGALLALLPFLPAYPGLRTLLLVFATTVVAQALSVKWVFMGQERLGGVARGLVLAQLIFALGVVATVRGPEQVVLVAVFRALADFAVAGFFWRRFAPTWRRGERRFSLAGGGATLRPALTLGAAHGLALMSFNFDALLIGLLLGPAAVGLYGAAYKPVLVLLALPVSYFIGLFPILARTHHQGRAAFDEVVAASFRLMAVVALPVGLCGTFLASPIIELLFGSPYAEAAPIFRLLAWSAVMTILRGTFRQSLNAAERQDLDLRCAATATGVNVLLTVILVRRLGPVGAAMATLVSEALWLTLALSWFRRHVSRTPLLAALWPSLVAGGLMAVALWGSRPTVPWAGQALLGLGVYAGTLLLLGQGPPLRRALSPRWRP